MGVSSLSQTHQTYNGKLPMMFCTINAVLVAISIIISSCSFVRKGEMGSDLIGGLVFMVVPAAYCQFFVSKQIYDQHSFSYINFISSFCHY
jgi:hypothetical protein